jgi:hypothetical protein
MSESDSYSHDKRTIPKNILPMHTDANAVCNLLNNCCLNPAYSLFPEISEKIENYIVDRIL